MGYDVQGRPTNQNPNPPSSGVTYDVNGKRVVMAGGRVGVSENSWNNNYLLNGIPGENEFYEGQISRGQRRIQATAPGQRSSLFDAMESRGLGRSSIVGDQLVAQAAGRNDAVAGVISDVQGQQFAARQQRINAYMQYMYAKKLKGKDKSFLQNLFSGAYGGAQLLAGLGNKDNNDQSQGDFGSGDVTYPTPPGPQP